MEEIRLRTNTCCKLARFKYFVLLFNLGSGQDLTDGAASMGSTAILLEVFNHKFCGLQYILSTILYAGFVRTRTEFYSLIATQPISTPWIVMGARCSPGCTCPTM